MEIFGSNISLFGTRKREAVPGIPPSTMMESKAATNNTGGSFAERIVIPFGTQESLSVSAVHRATTLIANTEAQFQPQYQKMNRNGGNFVVDMGVVGSKYISYGRKLNYLLQLQPNPLQTAMAFHKGLVIHRLLLGNGIAYIERNEYGDPVHFWLCTNVTYDNTNGKYLHLRYQGEQGPVDLWNIDRRDVIHWPNTFKTEDGLWGIPTLKFALDTLSLNKTISNQALESAAKGGRVKLLIGEDKPATGGGTLAFGRFGKEQVDAYAKEVNTKIYEQDVVALQNLDKVQQISMSAQEMQQVEMIGMTIDDVARFWGTQRPLLMADTNSHYTTYQNARMEFLQWTVQPDMVELEQEYNRKLLREEDFGLYQIHMCEQPIMRLDKESQAKVDQMRLQTGTATVNELRKQYDMPAVEQGDIVYVSTNLAELGSAKLRGNDNGNVNDNVNVNGNGNGNDDGSKDGEEK